MLDANIYQKGVQTEGFFAEDEAQLLIKVTATLSPNSNILEVGSYKGRSSLFILSAMTPDQHLFSVDSFPEAAAYSEHSLYQLHKHLDDKRVIILPTTLVQAYRNLRSHTFEMILIDADHSFVGFAQDIA